MKDSRTKAVYEEPCLEIVSFSSEDIITTSVPKDEDQGPWDPQI